MKETWSIPPADCLWHITYVLLVGNRLGYLTALGLVENTGGSAELGSAHAWALTEEGRAVERSILDHGPWST
jgi:hypothetical protein